MIRSHKVKLNHRWQPPVSCANEAKNHGLVKAQVTEGIIGSVAQSLYQLFSITGTVEGSRI